MGARPMSRLIQDMIRKALADELLFGRLVSGGKVTVDLDDKDQVLLEFPEPPDAAPTSRRKRSKSNKRSRAAQKNRPRKWRGFFAGRHAGNCCENSLV
jgi:hypothetical protein